MSPLRIAAILLIIGGILGLFYGGFTHSGGAHDMHMGMAETSMADTSMNDSGTMNVPVWAGVAGIVIGAVLLFGRKAA